MQVLVTQRSNPYLWLGLGCRRHTPEHQLAAAIDWLCTQYGIHITTIAGIATLSTKQTEVGLLAYCKKQRWQLLTFTPQELQTDSVPSPSRVVTAAIGIPSVAEAAALRGATQFSLNGKAPLLLIPKQVRGKVTLALAQSGQ
jgi:cobalt-precorrin 5A hydrolase/precorrin-3B C17-methyltransferase